MSLAHRRKRPSGRTEGTHRDARLITIAVEDTHIQEAYFRRFKSSRVRLKIIPTPGEEGTSSPKDVLGRLKAHKQEVESWEGDEFWVSVDTDRWGKMLKDVARDARSCGFQVVVSCPCFETWLLMHAEDLSPGFVKCDGVCARLRELFGSYGKKQVPPALLTPESVAAAIERGAKLTPATSSKSWPTTPGSQLHVLVQRLLDLGAEVLPDP